MRELLFEQIEELREEIGLQDRSAVEVKTFIDDTICDSYGDEFINVKFVIRDTYYDRSGDVLIKDDNGKLKLMVPIEDSEPEEYSDGLFWMCMYYDYARVR